MPDLVAIFLRLVGGASFSSASLALWVLGYLLLDGLVIAGAIWLFRVLCASGETIIYSRRVQYMVLYGMWTVLLVTKIVPMWVAAFY
ncbi:MAG: hypothetical protein KF699_16800 [Phycisphaeraceae bacterium]|nr:hypothetical protein [Fimbriimonadaceae bacterium]MBX3405069.1 hypothetical protein [Phycisphaeraceae bacterium]